VCRSLPSSRATPGDFRGDQRLQEWKALYINEKRFCSNAGCQPESSKSIHEGEPNLRIASRTVLPHFLSSVCEVRTSQISNGSSNSNRNSPACHDAFFTSVLNNRRCSWPFCSRNNAAASLVSCIELSASSIGAGALDRICSIFRRSGCC